MKPSTYKKLAEIRRENLLIVLEGSGETGGSKWMHVNGEGPEGSVEPAPTYSTLDFLKGGGPSFLDPQNETLGIWLDGKGGGAGKLWKPDPEDLTAWVGYALGMAQRYTRLGNQHLTSVFECLGDWELSAWTALKVTEKQGRPFNSDAMRMHATNILAHIMKCCAFVSNRPDKFALELADVYENVIPLRLYPYLESQKGRQALPFVDEMIEVLSEFEDGEQDHAFAKLKEEGKIVYAKDGKSFQVMMSNGELGEPRKPRTLRLWWEESRTRRELRALQALRASVKSRKRGKHK